MTGLLDGRVAVVSGGSDGIGKAIAKRFVEEGARVVICGRDKDKLDAALADLGGSAEGVVQDVSDADGYAAMIAKAAETHGGLDVLVNNAPHVGFGAVADAPVDDFRQNFRVNVDAPYAGMQAALKIMTPKGAGSIVNISSINGLRAMPGMAGYSSAKAALIHLTNLASMEAAASGVRVNAVAPGPIATPGTVAYIKSDPKAGEAIASGVPMKRIGEPEEVANVVLFLASDLSSYVTGACLSVDGGKANELAVAQS